MTATQEHGAAGVYERLPKHVRQVLAAVDSLRRVAQEDLLNRLLTDEEKSVLVRLAAVKLVPIDLSLDPSDPGPGGRWTGVRILPRGLELMRVAVGEFVPGDASTGYLNIFELKAGGRLAHNFPSNVVPRPGLT